MSTNEGNTEVRPIRPRARFVGSQLGKYFVGARLAAGGTASVYLARLAGPHNFERLVALKIIHEHLADEQEFVNMFLDEANLAAQLSHPNVVHVYELAAEVDVLFLAMEYLHGQPLSFVSRRASAMKRMIPIDIVAWIGARAADGLHHAHELVDKEGNRVGLVHRDVSPQNIFATYDGHVKVVDFGIARAEGRIAETALGQIKGKFSYMSPEQALGRAFDHRADLFALGATLYEVALGIRLFKGEDEIDTLRKVVAAEIPDPRTVRPDFPEELRRILMRALSTDAAERYSTGAELCADLEAFLKRRGAEDQRPLLAAQLGALFADERAVQEQAIVELRAAAISAEEAGAAMGDVTQVASGLDAIQPARRRFSKAWVVGVVLAIGGLVAAGAVLGRDNRGSAIQPAPASPPDPQQVVVDITLQPDVPAEVEVAGRIVDSRPPEVTLTKSSVPVEVVVRADGFDESTLTVVPDRNRTVQVSLTRAKPPAVPGSAVARPRRPARPVQAAPPKVEKEPRATGKPSPRSRVITENPF